MDKQVCNWIDLLGVPKTKPVPASELEALCRGEGPQFAVHSVSMVPDLGPSDPDQIPMPDLDTLEICPWDTRYAWLVADLYHGQGGAPYHLCPRLALKRQIERAAEAGYKFFVGFEPEFTVLRYLDDGQVWKAFDDEPPPGKGFRAKRQPFGYDTEFAIDAMPFLSEIVDVLNDLGWASGMWWRKALIPNTSWISAMPIVSPLLIALSSCVNSSRKWQRSTVFSLGSIRKP